MKRRNGIYLNVWNADGTLFKLESFDMQSSRVANSLNDIVEMMKSNQLLLFYFPMKMTTIKFTTIVACIAEMALKISITNYGVCE